MVWSILKQAKTGNTHEATILYHHKHFGYYRLESPTGYLVLVYEVPDFCILRWCLSENGVKWFSVSVNLTFNNENIF